MCGHDRGVDEDWDEDPDPGDPAVDARQAGDDAVEALAKVTAGMSNGEQRPEQQEMCRAVGEALVTGTHLVVQAGTGTGKSLAYLVPAVLSGKKVVVATATKALQDQLAEKDLPQVERGLGLGFTFAVLKGRSNYVCRQRVAEVGSGGIQPELGDEAGPDPEPSEPVDSPESGPEGLVDEVRTLLSWSEQTASGDRADLSFEPSARAWNMLSVGPRECPGAFNCPSGNRCFAEAARDRAAAADVVVVNTHLYGAHLASGRAVLPEHEVVVFDETHELEEVMTSSLGVELAPGRFRALALTARSLLDGSEADTVASLLSVGDQLAALLADRVGTRVLHDDADPPVDDAGAGRAARPGGGGGGARDRGHPPDRSAGLPALRRGIGPGSGRPQDTGDRCRRSSDRRPAPPDLPGRRRGGLGRRHPPERPPAALAHRRGARPVRRALG